MIAQQQRLATVPHHDKRIVRQANLAHEHAPALRGTSDRFVRSARRAAL
jgi:hypothetical protein